MNPKWHRFDHAPNPWSHPQIPWPENHIHRCRLCISSYWKAALKHLISMVIRCWFAKAINKLKDHERSFVVAIASTKVQCQLHKYSSQPPPSKIVCWSSNQLTTCSISWSNVFQHHTGMKLCDARGKRIYGQVTKGTAFVRLLAIRSSAFKTDAEIAGSLSVSQVVKLDFLPFDDVIVVQQLHASKSIHYKPKIHVYI